MPYSFLAEGTLPMWAMIAMALGLVFFSLIVAFSRRYKRCPSDLAPKEYTDEVDQQ